MKKIISITAIALILAGLGWAYYAYASFLPTYSRSVAESVLIDQTEPFIIQPTAAEILLPAYLPDHTWESVQLNVRTFSEFKYTESHTVSLPGHFFLLANPDERDKEISKFRMRVDTLITTINGQSKGYPKSSIYAPFIEEVNRIAATKADIKNVLAYTDGCENTGVFSVYREKDRKLLMQHPEKVQELLSKYGKPRDCHGLTIYILFKPKNDRDDEYFTLMSGFYKKLFEGAGAEVHIGSNVATNNQ